MNIFGWFENLFGGKWTNETVVQYQGDQYEHAIGGYSFKDHIQQLRERRPSLHHTQRLLVDSKIRELEYEMSKEIAREKEAERKREEENQWRRREQMMESQRAADKAHNVKSRETTKPVSGNVIAKPPKFDYDNDNTGWTTPAPSYSHTPSHSYSHSHSSSHSHSCGGSSYSSSDSGSSSSDSGGGGGCD